MSSATSILLIEPDSSSAAYMQAALRRAGYDVTTASNGKEGLIIAWRDQPDMILTELDLPDMPGTEFIRRLRADARTERKFLVALTARSDAASMHDARAAGVSEFIVKQPDALEVLLRALAPHRRGQSAPGATAPLQPGQILVLTSARGGSGVSTLSVNLAYELARRQGPEALAVADLCLPQGSLAPFLGSDAPHDLLEITELSPADRSPAELRGRLAWLPTWSYHLLPGPANPRRASRIRVDSLVPMLQALRATFPLTVIDLGRSLSRIAFLLFGQADLIAMVFTPDFPTCGNTRKVLDFLQEEGIDRDRMMLISNRPTGGEMATAGEVESQLGRRVEVGIPHAGTNFSLGHSLHAPFSLRFPEEAAALALHEAATRVSERMRIAA